jgi:basic membrane protein A
MLVDQCIDLPAAKVHCAVSREHEAAFLIGVAAGSLTQSDKVGVISAVDIPFLHRYSDAFAAGAKYVNPAVEIIPPRWVGGEHPFADPERAKALALELAAEGADQIFAATSAGNVGVFEAARQENFLTYGVDVNECQLAPGWVVDSTIKRVDVAIVAAVDQIIQGSNENLIAFGLAEEGMNIVSLTTTDIATSECLIAKSPELIEQLRTVREKIVSGEITVHDPLTEP